jgi:HNH endonuclease
MKQISYQIDENIKKLSDKDLLTQTDLLAYEHRKNSVLLLRHLREVEVRRLFVDLGFTSMHKYCLKQLKFSEGETQRRLTAARLLRELPEIEQKIETGTLNVTNLSKIQSFLRAEKAAAHPFTKAQKLELISELEEKSTREVEKELVSLSHQPALLAEKFQGARASVLLGEESQKFETTLSQEHQDLLAEFRNLYAHELKDSGNGSVLVFLLQKAIQYKKKKLGLLDKAKPQNAAPLPSAEKVNANKLPVTALISRQRKYLSVHLKKHLWQRAQACCEYRDAKSQKRCDSKIALEIDHVLPLALGGSDKLQNLRLLCRAHNSRRAVRTFS